MSIRERYFRVADYEKKEKGFLTEKQYLVYAYLLSISKWNVNEHHYYVYKNSFLVKDACALIGITQPTWRKALKKLEAERYIKINTEKRYYQLFFDVSWAKLDLSLIKFLVKYSYNLQDKIGGILPSLYGVICRYWTLQHGVGQECIVTLSQLNNLFFSERTKEHLIGIWTMLMLFKDLNLISVSEIPKVSIKGYDYISYRINWVSTKISSTIEKLQNNIDAECEDPVDDIFKKIIDNSDQFEDFYNKSQSNVQY